MRRLAIDHNIHLFCLPPHTTHRLQPLNVGIFGPLQQAWTKRCNEYYVTSHGREMDRAELIREYLALRTKVFSQDLIRKAWYKSGITSETWSANFFAEEDFAPSYGTSTVAHVPPSYPTSSHLTVVKNIPTPQVSTPPLPSDSEDNDTNHDNVDNHDFEQTYTDSEPETESISDSKPINFMTT